MQDIKTVIIMAAGMGTCFGHYTDLISKDFNPYKGKPMVILNVSSIRLC